MIVQRAAAPYISARVLFRALLSSLICVLCAAASAQELPLPEGGPLPIRSSETAGSTFLKPTKSIKPPPVATAGNPTVAAQPQVNAPTARLRRLILMPGNLPPEAMRETMLAGGQSKAPVTAVGIDAPAPVLTDLAGFFGSTVNPGTQKMLLETVSKGMSAKSKPPRRVELVGWSPADGIMAVAVYPES